MKKLGKFTNALLHQSSQKRKNQIITIVSRFSKCNCTEWFPKMLLRAKTQKNEFETWNWF